MALVSSIPGERLAGQSALGTESTTGPVSWAPRLPQKILSCRACSRAPCTRAWLWPRAAEASVIGHWGDGNSGVCPDHHLPQMRRSPIKKVRKSLALDIVDEDVKLMMSTLPKVGRVWERSHPVRPAPTPHPAAGG